MTSYQERSQLIKALSEQQYFDALTQRDRLAKGQEKMQILAPDGQTGRYRIARNDGGVTSNGDKTFNAAPPSDGFVRVLASPHSNAIALGHKSLKRGAIVRQGEEEVASNIIFLFQKDVTVDDDDKVVTKLYVGGDRDEPKEIYELEAGYKFWQSPTINKIGAELDDYIVNFVLEVDKFFDSPLETNPDLFKFCSVVGGSLTEVEYEVPNGFNAYDSYTAHQHGYFNTLQVEKRLSVDFDYMFMFIYSGNGRGGEPFSSATISTGSNSSVVDRSGLAYYLGGASGELLGKSSESLQFPDGQGAGGGATTTNTIKAHRPVSDFSGDKNSFGIEITEGSFVDHPNLDPPSGGGYCYLSFQLTFNSSVFKRFAVRWDSAIEIIENEIDRLNSKLSKKILPLTPKEPLYSGSQRRQIYLSKAVADTGLVSLINSLRVKIENVENTLGGIWSNRSSAERLLMILEKIVADTGSVPLVLPQILLTDEFASLPSKVITLAAKINEILSSESALRISAPFNRLINQAEPLAINTTTFGERSDAITALGLEPQNWFAQTRFSSGKLNINYSKIFPDFASSPIELECEIAGVPFTYTYGIEIGHFVDDSGSDYFYVYPDGLETEAGTLPYDLADYTANIKWRKRVNTKWFSV